MRRKIPSTQSLACFEAAARHESYTRAAQELALTQSAVSRQIGALEDFMGLALFRRTRHGVQLTAAGADYARQISRQLDAMERDTLDAMQNALNLGMDRGFRVETPLMWLTKAQTWGLSKALGGEDLVKLIVEESHTCYQGERGELHSWGHGCGVCPASELREKGYAEWDAAGREALSQ